MTHRHQFQPAITPDAVLQMHNQIAFLQIGEINVQRGTRSQRVHGFLAARALDFVAPENFRIGDNDEFRLVTNEAARERAGLNHQPCFRRKTVFLPNLLETLPLAVVVAKDVDGVILPQPAMKLLEKLAALSFGDLRFRRAFGQLVLGVLVPGLLVGLCMVPFIVMFIIKLIPLLGQLQHLHPGAPLDPATIDALKSVLFATLPVALVCAIPATYLSVCWKFTLPLIVDRQMDFGAAMKASWKMVNRHWWQVFGLVILISLVNVAGLCACCVGLLFSIPVGFAALMIAYETIFNAEKR